MKISKKEQVLFFTRNGNVAPAETSYLPCRCILQKTTSGGNTNMCLFRKMTFKEYVDEIYRQSALSYEQALIVGIYCWKEDMSVREAIRYARTL